MSATRLALLFVAFLVSLGNAAAAPQTFPKRAGGPAVTFTTDAIRATGATPGSTVYFAGVSLVSSGYTLRAATSRISRQRPQAERSSRRNRRTKY